MALDAFEEIVRNNQVRKRIEERIKNNELGVAVYVTSATLLAFLQKVNYEEKFFLRAMTLLYQLPQDKYKDRPKPSFLAEEFVNSDAWGDAITWQRKYSFPYSSLKENEQIKLDLVGWLDVGMVASINKDMNERDVKIPLDIIITKNKWYAEVARRAEEDETIPKFQVQY